MDWRAILGLDAPQASSTARPVGQDELGNWVYADSTGSRYSVGTQPAAITDAQRNDAVLMRLGLLPPDPRTPNPRAAVNALTDMVTSGFTAPANALRGEMVTYGDVLDTAGTAVLGANALSAPEGSLRAGNVRDPRLWHPASDIKLRMPADEMRFLVQDKGDLAPANALNIADLQGRTLVPAFGDRTRAGGMLTQINDTELISPVDLQGGADFMRSQGGIWASEPDAMKTKAKHIGKIADEVGDDPVLAYTAMGAQSGDFSRMMSDAVMGQLRPSMANMIDPAAVQRYDEIIRKTVDKDWPGVMAANVNEYINGMTGSNRRLLWQEMDKGVYREAGFPDIGATRLAITDPRLVNSQPFDTGLTFGRVDLSQPLTETTPDIHATYRTQIHGDYLGGLADNVPGELIWRDFFNERRAAGAASASDQRAFMMKPSIRQNVDQQMVDEVSRYLASRVQ